MTNKDGQRVDGIEACCPFHADDSPSFRLYANGGATCFGCGGRWSAQQVAAELGVDLVDQADYSKDWELPPATRQRKLAYEAIYNDVNGNPILKVVVETDGQQKWVTQWQFVRDVWRIGRPDCLVQPYRSEVLRSSEGPVYWVEGEKCVHALEERGLLATTSAGGSNAFKANTNPEAIRRLFFGRVVYILPDHDECGEKYAAQVREALQSAGAIPYIVNLSHTKKGEDVYDWFALGGTVAELRMLSERTIKRDGASLSQSLTDLADDIDSAKHAEKFEVGLPALDHTLKGLRPGNVVVLGGLPGSGKTALAVQIAIQCALKAETTGGDVLIFSQEMDRIELAERVVAWYHNIDIDSVTSAQARALSEKYGDLPFEILEHRVTVDEFERECRHWSATHRRPKLIILDYLQLMDWGQKRDEYSFIGDATPRIKRVAKDTGTVVLLLAQLSRAAGDRANPSSRDFKGNSSIEQDCDKAMILWHKEPSEEAVITIEAHVVKNRRGRLGMTKLDFDRPHYKFHDHIDQRRETSYTLDCENLEFF